MTLQSNLTSSSSLHSAPDESSSEYDSKVNHVCNINLEEIKVTKSTDDTKPEDVKYTNIFNLYRRIPLLNSLNQRLKRNNGKRVKKTILLILVLLYCIFFVAALLTPSAIDVSDYWCNGDGFLISNTAVFGTLLFYFQIIKPYMTAYLSEILNPYSSKLSKYQHYRAMKIATYIVLICSFAVFIFIDSAEDFSRIISALGGLVIILVGILFSKYPSQINYGQIFWGVGLQISFGLLILRWPFGRHLFQCLGSKVSYFLGFTDVGTTFAIGEFLEHTNSYAFKILPVILYFGLFISVLYHYGILQWIIIKLGWILQMTMSTTACESMATVANVFLGMSEAPLVIKPYIAILTKSELHTIMTGGFATVAGGVLAAYISFGIEPAHLLSASIMSAPAALTMSKLFYPETEHSATKHENIKIIKNKDRNLLQAIMDDLRDNMPLVAIITAVIIVSMGAAAFLNFLSDWCCQLLGHEEGVCEIQKLLGYLLSPMAWLMGVPQEDCYFVGYLLGTKIFVTEFLAYKELTIRFKQGLISARAVVISTYALCGFSNIASMGCAIGALTSMAPSRKKDISLVVVRAFVAGNFACFLTACVAGTLIHDPTNRLSAFNASIAL